MKAWGLFLSLMLFCAGCATPREPGFEPDRYGGPPLPDAENFDRAGAEANTSVYAAHNAGSIRAGQTRADCLA